MRIAAERVDRQELRWITILALMGLAGRCFWLVLHGAIDATPAETGNVAAAFARTSTIADAFGRGGGPTAHVNPILPALAGALYKIFGIRAPAAELILMAVALICAFATAGLFYDAFRRLGVGRNTRLAALALFCLLPINLNLEVIAFRILEGALATAMLAAGLRQIVISEQRATIGWKDVVIYAVIAALGLFINPAVGLALYLAAAIFMIRKMRLRQAFTATAMATLVLVAVLAPWTIRNAVVFGQFIPLRSNFGLEVAIANHPGTESNLGEAEIFLDRIKRIHPLFSQEAFEQMQRVGGEKAYADALGKEARRYMWQRPWETMRQIGRHLREFYFPSAWQFDLWESGSRATILKVLALNILALLGIAGALATSIGRGGIWTYMPAFLFAPALPYIVVQPTLRYHYLVSTLLIFLAVIFVSMLLTVSRSLMISRDNIELS